VAKNKCQSAHHHRLASWRNEMARSGGINQSAAGGIGGPAKKLIRKKNERRKSRRKS